MTVNWNRKNYTKEEFIDAWITSTTIAKCLEKLNLKPSGGNYKVARRIAKELSLTKDHMLGQGWSKGIVQPYLTSKQKLSSILVENSTYTSSNHLRKRLIKEEILLPICSAPFCPFKGVEIIDPFTGKKVDLKLELDHINGINTDNRIENLRLLCCFCHSYTNTWRGKNMHK